MSNFCFISQSKNTHPFFLSRKPLTFTATHLRVLAGVLGGITSGGAPYGAWVCPQRVHRLHRAHDLLWVGDLLLLQAVVAPLRGPTGYGYFQTSG